MKSHIQQQQLQQQQMQENAFKLKEMQDNKADDDIIKAHYIKNNGDIDATAKSTLGLVGPAKSQHLQQLSLQGQMDRAKMTNEQNMADVASADHQSQIIDAVMKEPDPEKRQALWANGKALGVAKNWAGMASVPDQAPDNDTLAFTRAVILGGKASGERAIQASTLAANEAKLPKEQADAAQAVRANDSSILGASPTYGDYQDKLAKLSPDRRGVFPDLSTEDRAEPITQEHLTAIRQPGLTGDQQVMTGQRAQAEQDRNERATDSLELRQEMLNMRRDQIAREKGQTANSAAVDRRFSEREYNAATAAESQLSRLRSSLGRAIASGGKSYVDRFGNMKPAEGVANADDLLQENKDRYQQISIDLKTALENKYNAMSRLGGTPKVSLEDAIGAIDAADAQSANGGKAPIEQPSVKTSRVQSAAPTAPPASAPSAPAKTTEADIRQGATRRGFKPNGPEADAAVKAARAKGRI